MNQEERHREGKRTGEEVIPVAWNLEKNRPIYVQLVETLQNRIVSGVYPSGTRMASVRDLAEEAAVNPNTMQRALAELEQCGLLRGERTNGRFVTEDKELIESVRHDLAQERIDTFLDGMSTLGYERNDIIRLIEQRCIPNPL